MYDLCDYLTPTLTVRCLELLLVLWGVAPQGGAAPVLSPLASGLLSLLVVELVEALPGLLHHHSLFPPHVARHVVDHSWSRSYGSCQQHQHSASHITAVQSFQLVF